MDDSRAYLAAAWRAFWADPPPPPPLPPPPLALDSIRGQITGGIAALQPSPWLEALICNLFQADPSKPRLRFNGACSLSLHELMVVATMASSLHVTSAPPHHHHPATTPQQLFALLHAAPAFDVALFLTLHYLVSMGWRCCDGSKCAARTSHPLQCNPSNPLQCNPSFVHHTRAAAGTARTSLPTAAIARTPCTALQ